MHFVKTCFEIDEIIHSTQHMIPSKTITQKYQPSVKYNHAYVLSTFFGPFCMNYRLNAGWYGCQEPVNLLGL